MSGHLEWTTAYAGRLPAEEGNHQAERAGELAADLAVLAVRPSPADIPALRPIPGI